MHPLLWLGTASLFASVTGQGDKYTDENRPYKFGFNIEGHQHRKEEKDEKGIIKGEYGFITADGYYRVTVYATDENGDFKIISMKNYYVGFPPGDPTTTPAPSPTLQKSKQGGRGQLTTITTTKTPTQLNLLTSTIVPPAATQGSTVKSLSGVVACSSCLLPTTTKAPPVVKQPTPIGPGTIETPAVSNIASPPLKNGPSNLQSPPQPNNFRQPNSAVSAPAGQLSPGTPNDKTTLRQDTSPKLNFPDNQNTKPGFNRPGSTPYTLQANPGVKYQPNVVTARPIPSLRPFGNSLANPPIEPVKGDPSLGEIDDKYMNRPPAGKERAGLPPGVTVNDIMDLLYRFNYTVGFHGHHEDGYRNGDKTGDYFVNSRDGDSRRVQYIANEFGYQPNITLVKLGENDVARPREETEKEYGLKGYEFKWFYRK